MPIEGTLLIMLCLGLFCLLVSSKSYGSLGYRGVSLMLIGTKAWQFSNKLFGGFLILSTALLFLVKLLLPIEAGAIHLLSALLFFITMIAADLLTLRKYRGALHLRK